MQVSHSEYRYRHDYNYALIHTQLLVLWLPMWLVYLVLVQQALLQMVSNISGVPPLPSRCCWLLLCETENKHLKMLLI